MWRGKPYGEGPFQALQAALGMAEVMVFLSAIMTIMWEQPTSMTRERQLDIPGPPGRGSGRRGLDGYRALEPVEKDGKLFWTRYRG